MNGVTEHIRVGDLPDTHARSDHSAYIDVPSNVNLHRHPWPKLMAPTGVNAIVIQVKTIFIFWVNSSPTRSPYLQFLTCNYCLTLPF